MTKFIFISFLFILSACSAKESVIEQPVVVKTIEVARPAPIVPEPDRLTLRPVEWDVISEKNAAEKFTASAVYFGLDEENYRALTLNISDLRGYTEQQSATIQTYKKYFLNAGNR